MKKGFLLLFLLISHVYPCHARHSKSAVSSITYDQFLSTMNGWVAAAMGKEHARRQQILTGLNQIMSEHHFDDKGTPFSQFQRFLVKPYDPNLRDIYYVLNRTAQVGVSPADVSEICSAAQISPIQADALDLALYGFVDKINNGNLSPLDIALFQSEVSWLTGNNSTKITIGDCLNQIESNPDEDCDSILKNLDSNGITVLEEIVSTAVPGWTPAILGYASFDKDLTAWIQFKFTDAASQAVAHELIVTQVLESAREAFEAQVPFPEFQKTLLKTDPTWSGPILYFTLSKFTADDLDNLPVPTDALEAIFRCAGLDIYDCQPNVIDRIYTSLLSHQNGGTAGEQLTASDTAGYSNIITYITTQQGKTVDDVIAYIHSIFNNFSDYAQQDLLSIIDPEHNPRPYHYSEDTEYFRNDQKLLPLHAEDAQYYREHVIPSLGIGKYSQADNVGRYRYVTGKGGEYYLTVHYNHFLRVDQLISAVEKTGKLMQNDIEAWISLYTDKSSPFYDSQFYKEVQDMAQMAGVATTDLLNLMQLDPTKLENVLTQLTNLFLIIQANPPPVIP